MGKERNAIGGSWPPLIGGNSAKLLANQVEQLGRIHQVGESRVETRVFAYLRVDVVLFCLFVCLFVFVRERFENWSSSGGLRIFDAFTEFFLSFFLCVCCFLGFVFWFSRYCARSVTELFSLLFVAVVVVVVVVERRLGRRPVTWSSSQMQRRRSALRRLVKNAIPLPRLIKVSACALHFFDVVPRLSFCGAGVQSHYGSFSANRRSISRFDSKVAARRLSLSLSLFLPDFSWFVCVWWISKWWWWNQWFVTGRVNESKRALIQFALGQSWEYHGTSKRIGKTFI